MGSETPSDKPRDVALWWGAVVLACVFAGWGLAQAGTGPFERGWLGHNGARYALIARNHERLGLTHLGGAPLISSADRPAPATVGEASTAAPDPDVYAHHPPALGWVIALVFRVAGVSEAAACSVPIAATLLLLVLFAWLVRAVAGARAGAFAVLAAAVQPMISVYGSHVDVQGTPVLLLSLATLSAYVRWLRGGSLLWVLVASAASSAFDWYGLYVPVACAAHALWRRPRRYGVAVGLVAWSLALFGLWLGWLSSLPGVELADVFGAAGVRGVPALAGAGGQLSEHVSRWIRSTLDLMPAWPGWLLIAAWVAIRTRGAAAERRAADRESPGVSALIVLLLLPPVVHALLFPAGLLVHAYWLFALPLPLALAAGIVLSRCHAALAWPVMAVLMLTGAAAAQRVLAERDSIPQRMGLELAARTAEADVILTNYDVNPFVEGEAGDRYVLMRPEVAFYADRVVRGGIDTPARLSDALIRRNDADWFLLVPWPGPVGADFRVALASASDGEPLELSSDPPVLLYRLGRRR